MNGRIVLRTESSGERKLDQIRESLPETLNIAAFGFAENPRLPLVVRFTLRTPPLESQGGRLHSPTRPAGDEPDSACSEEKRRELLLAGGPEN